MALNNLRVIYNNLADLSTTSIVASSTQTTSTPASNLTKDAKGLVWRSSSTTGGTVSAALLIDLGSPQSISGIVLPFTNLVSNAATITVVGYSAPPDVLNGILTFPITTGTAVSGFTQTTNCCPWNSLNLPDWGSNPVGANTYAYGGGTYARVWLSTAIQALQARYITITITDSGRTANTGYCIEVSRLIIGKYWSPKYNTGYGMTSTQKDLSVHERTESGDLVSQRGPRFSSLTFNLEWLDPSDRIQLTKLMLGNGLPRPVLISLFPDNGTTAEQAEMERTHQIYGKMMTIPGISYAMLDIYSTQFEIEEV